MKTLTIYFVSDTHGHHDDIMVPPGDIVCHLGDYSNDESHARPTEEIIDWLTRQPCQHRILIYGNHDGFLFDHGRDLVDLHLDRQGVLVFSHVNFCEMVELEGLRIGVAPFSGAPLDMTALQDGCDILLTHSPPHGILDSFQTGAGRVCFGEHLALDCLHKARPLLHAFGHIHARGGEETTIAATRFVNAASQDNYRRYAAVTIKISGEEKSITDVRFVSCHKRT
jgi:predicted phosphodiesterase